MLSSENIGTTPSSFQITDFGYGVLWDKNDGNDIFKHIMLINMQKNKPIKQKLVESFENRFIKYYNDQKSSLDIEPLQVERKDDLVVNTGLIRIAQLVVGESSVYFTHFASGTGTSKERPQNNLLTAENMRVSMISSGYATAAGTSMKFTGFFPSSTPSATVTEGGVFDTSALDEGVMLFRTLYPTPINHVADLTFYTLSQTILQSPFT